MANAPWGAIWDLDGTLVDTEQGHFESWRMLLRENEMDLTYEQFRPTFGRRNHDVLVEHFGFEDDANAIGALADRKEDLFRAGLAANGVRFQPGAADLVRHLDGLGFEQAIASSAPRANIDFMLEGLPCAGRFRCVVSAEEIKVGKPAPDIFIAASNCLQVKPRNCVVFEDAPAGVKAGRDAGCRVVAIATGFPSAQLCQADLIVDSFAEIMWPPERWTAFFSD